MSFSGSLIQNAIYIAQQPPEWPIAAADWERAAEAKLDAGAFGYIAGGAGAESTMRSNLAAFEKWQIRPRMLTGNVVRDQTVDVLGLHSAAPFFFAPVGVLSIAHNEGELGVARASASSGVPLVLSSAATHSIEEIAETGCPRWFQLYWVNDREICASFVQRAETAGYAAIVVTLDTLQLGWRPRDLRQAYLPFIKGEGCGQFFSDPVFLSRLDKPPAEDPLTAAATMLATFPNVGLTWEDLAWLRSQTSLPLLVKGVLTADDAKLALDHGMDGVIVSNHGGRQVDGAVGALDALVEVRDELPEAVVLMDGGIRCAADVVKAMALGADAVLLGRPYAYALAVGGQRGVEELTQNLMAEIDLTLALAGATSVRELDRSWISASS
ncbi:MAG TPA: alpha-hydroxy-acid oxidizing protein [Gaiellaceae bacterium]|jgi:isopentenyl diphosphate isomerase/L-lactate dehydrogenase-like FMN-dependent dehydrogenase